MKKDIIGMILASVLFAGCATFKAQNCGENAGYQKGVNDARAGRIMSVDNFSLICGKESAVLSEKGYREGYRAGNDKGGAQLNVNFQNGKLGLTGAYSCLANYNNDSFSDNASTEDQARASVLAKCRAKHPACTPGAVNCSKN